MVKRLVVGADGTWNIPDRIDRGKVSPSNVAKLILALAPTGDDRIAQLPLYHKGVGTGRWDRLRGGAYGRGLGGHVREVYRSIAEEYEPGDEIFLFGFSRGAFTVRSAAGLIFNSGILRKQNLGKLDDAYRLYRRRDSKSRPNGIEARLFRKQYSHPDPEVAGGPKQIKCIGVWDTVGALGIPAAIPWLPAKLAFFGASRRWGFHNTTCSTQVEYAYQALAIDERRPQFTPTLWEKDKTEPHPIMKQMWFSGVHTNIGGGYSDSGLSDLSFDWMKEKAKKCGLTFDTTLLDAPPSPNALGELRDSRTGFYKLFRAAPRQIGRAPHAAPDDPSVILVTHEDVHPSALERQKQSQNPSYAPENLVAFLDKRRSG